MRIFKVECEVFGIKPESMDNGGELTRQACRSYCHHTEEFNRHREGKTGCFITDAQETTLNISALTEDKDPLALTRDYLYHLGLTDKNITFEETDFITLCTRAVVSDRVNLLSDDETFIQAYGFVYSSRMRIPFGEGILRGRNRQELTRDMKRCLVSEQMTPEIDRIWQGQALPGVKGHPVHYMLYTDNTDQRRQMGRILLDALYVKGRIANRRFGFYDMSEQDSECRDDLKCLYAANRGGAVLIRFSAEEDDDDGEYAGGAHRNLEFLGELVEKYRHEVLTVFCLPLASDVLRQMILANIPSVSVVEIREDSVDEAAARRCLRYLAKEAHITPDETPYAIAENGPHSASSLSRAFDLWRAKAMKTIVYPQYRGTEAAEVIGMRAAPTGSAFDRLDAMIGLTEAKAVICRAVNYFKYRSLLSGREIRVSRPALHMCFTGNPGTAKTTVARLFARILAENKILTTGAFVELGRGDLVAKYVGWTADTVKKRFREAKGGVLFIDEAYSLVDDRSGSFGDEAINTIVQEMENHREDVIVIFAGYPDKMEGFLRKNPGLRSRIAFHVPFPDYTTEELVQIAEKIAGENGCCFSDAARGKLAGIFDRLRLFDDFGNGRCARNMVESAQMHLADRLSREACDSISDEMLGTILPEDLEMPAITRDLAAPRRIGFAV